jgi:hypothetical protein
MHWKKSSYSGAHDNCVEVASLADGGRGVRDSKDPARAVIMFGGSEWATFLEGVRGGCLRSDGAAI